MLRKLLLFQGNINVLLRTAALHAAALPRVLHGVRRSPGRLRHDAEQADEACAGEDHDRHKQQQQRDNLGAERTERRDQRHAEQTAEQARAAALLPVRIKGEQLLPEGRLCEAMPNTCTAAHRKRMIATMSKIFVAIRLSRFSSAVTTDM